MIHSRSSLLCGCFFLSDVLVTAAAWLGAYFLPSPLRLPPPLQAPRRFLPLLARPAAGDPAQRHRLPPGRPVPGPPPAPLPRGGRRRPQGHRPAHPPCARRPLRPPGPL